MRSVSTAFAEAIVQPHSLAVRVDVLRGGNVVASLQPVDGTVTLDAVSATRGRASLTFAGLDLLVSSAADLLAPNGTELRIYRGFQYPDTGEMVLDEASGLLPDTSLYPSTSLYPGSGGTSDLVLTPGATEMVSLGVFPIQSVQNNDDLTVSVDCLDRSQFVIDASFEEPYEVAAGTNIATAIYDVIVEVAPVILIDGYSFASTDVPTPLLAAAEGEDRWAFAQGLAASIGGELFWDGDGVLVLQPIPSPNGSPVASIVEGEGGTLLSAERNITREGGYNRVIVTGEGSETDVPRGVATDEDPNSLTYYYGSYGRKPDFYANQFISTDVQAQDAAEGRLATVRGLFDSISLSAVVNPALEPGDVVTIEREMLGITESHQLDAVSIPLTAEGTLTAQTRAVLSQ